MPEMSNLTECLFKTSVMFFFIKCYVCPMPCESTIVVVRCV